ncbi:hypothetical protein O181_024205 [Austropuccinia psidii MF-1]|uniref:Integrase catalytic domain-containing protein n=1 Tax=Austropuccinia psidii MF-1 TaxID=1389203 RepID=A0A9Q3CK44_9BASI|nr:hypothetical protein [Austropuccinia psidii MF-1]
MLGTKLSFYTACHPQTDELPERMIQKMGDINRIFCVYSMEYKYHEGYTHDWVILLPAIQLAYNTSKHSTTVKSPSLVGKGWDPSLLAAKLKKNLLTIHTTTIDFHDIWRKKCYKSER